LGQDSSEVQEYAEEAAKCLENDCFKAAIILSWNVLILFLYRKIETYGLSNFARVARKKGFNFKGRINTIYDLNKLADADLIETSHDVGIFDRNAKEQLKQLALTRNGCAHVTQLVVDEIKAATFISDILNHITIVKSSTIAKGTSFVVQSVLAFPNETAITKHIRGISNFRRLIAVLEAILDELQATTYDKLSQVGNYHAYLRIATEILTTSEKRQRLYIIFHQRYFLSGSYPAQAWVFELIEKLLHDSTVKRMVIRKGLTAVYISHLGSSGSYQEAGQRARILSLFGADLTKEQLNKVAEAIVSNNQVYASYTAQPVLRQLMDARLYELTSKNIDQLKKTGLIT